MENGNTLSRRRMLQLTGVGMLGMGAALAGAGCSSGGEGSAQESKDAAATQQPAQQDERVTLTVYDPSGNIEVTQEFAPRLDSLDGKTIAFLGNDMWEEQRTFEELGKLMAKAYPNTKIITQENFPRHSDQLTQANNGIAETMKELGVDAVIVGNAG